MVSGTCEATVCEIDNKWCYAVTLRNSAPCNVSVFGNIDVSYSMSGKAALPESTDTISYLALMQSVVGAVVDSLPDGVEVKLGSFADDSRIEYGTDCLNASARNEAKTKLRNLAVRGMTNLFAAIEIGYKSLLPSKKRIVLVLTDGEPTVRPPQGELVELRRLNDEAGETSVIIVAIANSRLDLPLMHEICNETGGCLVYVNDASMGATCVINTMAQICTLTDINTFVSVVPDASDDCADVELVAPADSIVAGKLVRLGMLTQDSYRTVVATRPKIGDAPPELLFRTTYGDVVAHLDASTQARDFVAAEYARCTVAKTLSTISKQMVVARLQDDARTSMNLLIDHVVALSEGALTVASKDIMLNLLKGLDGELSKALLPEYILSWGPGAIYAALNAHWNRICMNFKDPDVQMYATAKSALIRQQTAANFKEPPRGQAVMSAPPRTMSQYYNPSGGCILPGSLILTRTGAMPIERLQPGMSLRSGSKIVHVLKMPTTVPLTAAVFLSKTVAVTPFHPISLDGDNWLWPCQKNHVSQVACSHIYNIVLERHACAIEAEGTKCLIISLGHGLVHDEVAAHKTYGDYDRMVGRATRAAHTTDGHRLLMAQ